MWICQVHLYCHPIHIWLLLYFTQKNFKSVSWFQVTVNYRNYNKKKSISLYCYHLTDVRQILCYAFIKNINAFVCSFVKRKCFALNIVSSVSLYTDVLVAAADSCCSNTDCPQTECSRHPNAKGSRWLIWLE